MKRIIKDYTNVTPEQLELIAKAYPDGIDTDMVITFTSPKGEYIRALEVRTDDILYLFKMSSGLLAKIDDHTEDDFDLGDTPESYGYDEETGEFDEEDD